MAHRIDSYCGTPYVDTEAESMGGFYPVGPHPYEVCLALKHLQLTQALQTAAGFRSDIEEIGKQIKRRDAHSD